MRESDATSYNSHITLPPVHAINYFTNRTLQGNVMRQMYPAGMPACLVACLMLFLQSCSDNAAQSEHAAQGKNQAEIANTQELLEALREAGYRVWNTSNDGQPLNDDGDPLTVSDEYNLDPDDYNAFIQVATQQVWVHDDRHDATRDLLNATEVSPGVWEFDDVEYDVNSLDDLDMTTVIASGDLSVSQSRECGTVQPTTCTEFGSQSYKFCKKTKLCSVAGVGCVAKKKSVDVTLYSKKDCKGSTSKKTFTMDTCK